VLTTQSRTDEAGVSRSHGADRRAKPNFLYVGAAKAGSTWIEYALRDHPEIYLPPVKDIYFFDRLYDRGLDWYLDHFKKAPASANAIGELSHDYFMDRAALERIRADLPGVKLIVCLRNPVDRVFSRYVFGLSVGDVGGLDIVSYSRRTDIEAEGNYLENLKNIYELFERDRVLLLFYDDLKADSRVFAQRIYKFIGVDSNFVPSSVDTVILGAQSARFAPFTYAAMAISGLMRQLGLVSIVGWAKRQDWVMSILFRQLREKPRLAAADRQALYARYSSWFDDLERLIGTPLPPTWQDRHEP
jgi:Sulfotransferase domain